MESYVQLCGHFAVELRGRRVEERLPARQGRALFAYLALHRDRALRRDELIEAVWPRRRPADAAAAMTVLLSKVRGVVGADALVGRGEVRLALPEPARVDVEQALLAAHAAESAARLGQWGRAISSALCAELVAQRPLLPDHDLPWLSEWRQRLDDVLDRAYEAHGEGCLGLGGCEVATAERVGRRLIGRNPLRESGYRLVMRSLAERGNIAEALHVYEQLRTMLRESLGVAPGPAVRALHAELLAGSAA